MLLRRGGRGCAGVGEQFLIEIKRQRKDVVEAIRCRAEPCMKLLWFSETRWKVHPRQPKPVIKEHDITYH